MISSDSRGHIVLRVWLRQHLSTQVWDVSKPKTPFSPTPDVFPIPSSPKISKSKTSQNRKSLLCKVEFGLVLSDLLSLSFKVEFGLVLSDLLSLSFKIESNLDGAVSVLGGSVIDLLSGRHWIKMVFGRPFKIEETIGRIPESLSELRKASEDVLKRINMVK